MFSTPLFGAWRPVWDASNEARALGQRADQLARHRSALALKTPDSRIREGLLEAETTFWRLYRYVPAASTGKEYAFWQAHATAITALQPLIEACRWPRWLQLERALATASAVSDFLTAALVLRTQIDEIGIHREIERWTRRLASGYSGRASPSAADCQQIREFATFLWERVLHRREAPTREQITSRPDDPDPPVDLKPYRTALLDYVHPNHGSHAATARPEESRAGTVLLEAFVQVYDAFFKLDAVRLLPCGNAPDGEIDIPAPQTEWELFVSETLPHIDRRMRERHRGAEWAPKPLACFDGRTHPDATKEALLAEFTRGEEENVRSLCEALRPASVPISSEELRDFPRRYPEFGLPAGGYWLVAFARARACAERLDELVEQVDPAKLSLEGPADAQWISFIMASAEMSLALSLVKTDAMRLATIRMLNRRNPLGAVLCARSLLEHYAVGKHLANQIHDHWRAVEDAIRSAADPAADLKKLEESIGRFLAGTTKTAERATSWRERWQRLGMARPLGLREAVNAAFPESDPCNFAWNYFSRIMKGTQLTGGDLLDPVHGDLADRTFGRVVAVLARLEGGVAGLDLWAPIEFALHELARTRSTLESLEVSSVARAVRRGLLPDRLELGRDVFGTGTEKDPYRFREELNYYRAYERFCEQHGIVVPEGQRWTWGSEGFMGTRVLSEDGREIFFRKGSPAEGSESQRSALS